MNKKILIFCCLTLGVYLVIRLLNQSQMIWTFPLDVNNDLSSHLAKLFFLDRCGFEQLCNYWYNSTYAVLKFYPPAWFFFTLPLYKLANNIQAAAFVSLISMFALTLAGFLLLSRAEKFSIHKTLAFFFLFVANPIAIGNFIRLGRLPEMFGWVVFVFIASLLLYYKNKPLTWKFYLTFVALFGLELISYQSVWIVSLFFVLGFLLIRNRKEIMLTLLSGVAGLSLVSWWLYPVIKDASKPILFSYRESLQMLTFTNEGLPTVILGFLVPIALLMITYLYLKQNQKDTRFYVPIIVLAVLVLTKVIALLPMLQNINADIYNKFLIFFVILMFFKLDFRKFLPIAKRAINLCLIILPIALVIFSAIYTPWFVQHTETEIKILDILGQVNGRFVIIDPQLRTSLPQAYYSYAPIYLNLSSTDGWSPQEMPAEYLEKLQNIQDSVKARDFVKFNDSADYLKLENVIAYSDDCSFLKEAGGILVEENVPVCLYKFN